MKTKEIINKTFDKYLDSVQKDKGLKALADIKTLIERYYDGEHYKYSDISEILDDIEELCNHKNKFLYQIKKEIKWFYEMVGRDLEDGLWAKNNQDILIKKILKIIKKANVPSNYEVISRLKLLQ